MFRRLFFASTFVAAGLAVAAVSTASATPEPDFAVIQSTETFEIREYPSLVIAKTMSGEGQNSAFRRLFAYISGENQGAREIAMTAPVLVSDGAEIAMTAPVLNAAAEDGSGKREMAFILPFDYTIDTAPIPSDPTVSLGTIPARRVAVATFSGWADADDFAEAEADLRADLAKAGIAATEATETAQYDPPWTLGPFRRNEVLIPIAVE